MEALDLQPIIFGDFMKMGADPADRMYEDLTDINKLENVLNDVSDMKMIWISLSFPLHKN